MALTRQLVLGVARVMRDRHRVRERWEKRSWERLSRQVLDFRIARVWPRPPRMYMYVDVM